MASKRVAILKFVGTISLGLLTVSLPSPPILVILPVTDLETPRWLELRA